MNKLIMQMQISRDRNSYSGVTMQSIYKYSGNIIINNKFRNMYNYFSDWSLENNKFFDMICASLMKLPRLELFTIVSSLQYQIGFKSLCDRFKAVIDKEWYNNEKW